MCWWWGWVRNILSYASQIESNRLHRFQVLHYIFFARWFEKISSQIINQYNWYITKVFIRFRLPGEKVNCSGHWSSGSIRSEIERIKKENRRFFPFWRLEKYFRSFAHWASCIERKSFFNLQNENDQQSFTYHSPFSCSNFTSFFYHINSLHYHAAVSLILMSFSWNRNDCFDFFQNFNLIWMPNFKIWINEIYLCWHKKCSKIMPLKIPKRSKNRQILVVGKICHLELLSNFCHRRSISPWITKYFNQTDKINLKVVY